MICQLSANECWAVKGHVGVASYVRFVRSVKFQQLAPCWVYPCRV